MLSGSSLLLLIKFFEGQLITDCLLACILRLPHVTFCTDYLKYILGIWTEKWCQHIILVSCVTSGKDAMVFQ
jgi:hypothetical protein